MILPIVPFLYWQGQRVRKRVGRLPDAEGATVGVFGEAGETLNLLAIGESTVAGVGAKNHSEALGGQLAKYLSLELKKSVRWHVLGESGITVNGTLERLVPKLPETTMDFVVVALGGNDTFKVSSPNRWRSGMKKLIEKRAERLRNVARLDFERRSDGSREDLLFKTLQKPRDVRCAALDSVFQRRLGRGEKSGKIRFVGRSQ